MNSHGIKSLKKFKDKLTTTGVVSKDEILTVEGALGQNLFTSNIKINNFSSMESSVGVTDILDIIDRTVETEKIDLDQIISTKDIVSKVLHVTYKLKHLSKTITAVGEKMSAEMIENIYKDDNRYTFTDERGETHPETSDILTDFHGPRSLILDNKFISSFTGIPSDKIENIVRPYLPLEFVDTYSDGWYDRKSYNLGVLLANQEFSKLLDSGSYTQTEINAKSYLDVITNYKDVTADLDACVRDGERLCESVITNSSWYSRSELEIKYKRFSTLLEYFDEDKLTIITFLVLLKLLP